MTSELKGDPTMTATTPYLIRASTRKQYTWLQYLVGTCYGWCVRKDAPRIIGRDAAVAVATLLHAAMTYRGFGHISIAIVPATGGVAVPITSITATQHAPRRSRWARPGRRRPACNVPVTCL
jgi:hypothetical protein